MFDLRYHAASLAAVFVALAVGIVVGVAIASGGEVEKQTAELLQQQRDELRADRDRAEDRLREAEAAAAADTAFIDALYLPVVQDRFSGERIALLQLGEGDSGAGADVEDMLRLGGATGPQLTLSLPLDPVEVDAALAADPATAGLAGSDNRAALGEALGRELATIGDGPIWGALQGVIGAEAIGLAPAPLDGAVAVRTWDPEGSGLPDAATPEVNETEAFLIGLLRGLGSLGAPVVGTERLSDEPSWIPFFADAGVSSVDDVGRATGDIALTLLLSGGEPGHYGAKDTAADGPAPPLPDGFAANAGG